MKQKRRTFRLKRDLGFYETIFYGIGVILGAGIYAVIGEGAKLAQGSVWISFIIAAVIGSFTGLSYAELASRQPKEAAEYNYTKKAFKREWFSFTVSWLILVAGVFSVAAVSIGFAGYFTALFGGTLLPVAASLIILLSAINWYGIKESARFNMASTLIEMSGLVIVILIGMSLTSQKGFSPDLFRLPDIGFSGILSAVGLVFFAYIGFEDIVNVSEEVKDPKRNVPRALVISIAITTAFYILVSIFTVSGIGWQALASSSAPLTTVAIAGLGGSGMVLMSVIALFATANTALIILIVLSRILYGVSKQEKLPHSLSGIGRRGTPEMSILLVCAAAVAMLFVGSLKIVASLTDIGLFVVYICVNLSLIKIRMSSGKVDRQFKSPVNIGRFPVLAFLGLLTSLFMILYFDPVMLLGEAAIILAGLGVYKAFNG